MSSPSVLPACALVAGVATGIVTGLPSFGLHPIALILATLLLAAASRRLAPAGRRVAFCGILCTAGALHGAIARDAAVGTTLRSRLDATLGGFTLGARDVERAHDPVPLRAVLLEDAAPREDFVSLRARAQALWIDGRWHEVSGGVAMSVNGDARELVNRWRRGRTVVVPATFRRPARYLNDGVADFERDAALDGLTLFASVKSGLLVDVVAPASRLSEAAGVTRARVRAAVSRWVGRHGEIPAAIVTAVLIGDRTGLPADVRVRLQSAGTYHVIAISGGNIAILAALTVGLFSALGVRPRLAAAATIAVLLIYAGIVAAGPSVWRATLMAVIYFAARVFDLRTPPWHALAVTAGVMAIVHPLDVRDAGFLLTFGATAGLLAVAQSARTWWPRRRAISWVVASIAASLAAELVLLPVSASVFSRVTAAGLLLNLIAIPAMVCVQVGGMVVVVAASVPAVAASAGWVAGQSASLLVESARLVDHVPGLVHRVPPPAAWLVVAYYGALLGLRHTAGLVRLGSRTALALAAVLIATGINPFVASDPSTVMRLTMLDVGQGESILVEVPGAEPLLIDAGGAPFGSGSVDIGGRVVAPALWARHVRRLGALLVTHGDPDHIGGGVAVLSDFAPRTLWWGTPVPPHQPSRTLLETASRQGRTAAFLRAGDAMRLGDARVRILHPPPPDWERQKVRNDDSLVLEIVYRDVAVLLTGDISSSVERMLVPQLTPAPARILKVAHHGSRTSSSPELLEAWRPQVALISAGQGNTFGHPAREVLARLESIGAHVYRTDSDGQITLETDGSTVSVRTFNGGEK